MSALDLRGLPLVDVHLHPPLRAAATPAEGDFRRFFTESDLPGQLPHVESSLFFQRGVATLARTLDIGLDGADWRTVALARHRLGPEGWVRHCLHGAGADGLLVDYGYSTGAQFDHADLRALGATAGVDVRRVFRLETALG